MLNRVNYPSVVSEPPKALENTCTPWRCFQQQLPPRVLDGSVDESQCFVCVSERSLHMAHSVCVRALCNSLCALTTSYPSRRLNQSYAQVCLPRAYTPTARPLLTTLRLCQFTWHAGLHTLNTLCACWASRITLSLHICEADCNVIASNVIACSTPPAFLSFVFLSQF